MSAPPSDSLDREPSNARLISFRDNVLSVAITLLVFDARVPGNAFAWANLWISYAIYCIAPLSFAWLQFV